MTRTQRLLEYNNEIDDRILKDRAMVEKYVEYMNSPVLTEVEGIGKRAHLLTKMTENMHALCRAYLHKSALIRKD